MDAKQFLAEFRHIASAPGGVQRLREMVYQLAVSGLLTEQTSSAKELLSEIEKQRALLIKEKKYKRIPKLEKEVVDSSKSLDIPNNWIWTRLLDVGEISPKNTVEDEDKLADFLPMSGISELHNTPLHSELRPWNTIKKGYTHFANNDVVVAKITPCFENGKAAVIRNLKSDEGIGAGTTELHVFRPIHEGVLPDYVYIYLRSPYFRVQGESSMTGTAGQKRLPTSFFAAYPFPLPPTEEQSRIVAKVDELMILCDKLEVQQQQKRKLQNHLRQATLQAVSKCRKKEELNDGWERISENLSHLFAEAVDVVAFKGMILDLAVSGQLLNYEPMPEETGGNLLSKIEKKRVGLAFESEDQELKEAQTMARKIKKQNHTRPDLLLPKHWTWGSFLEISQVVVDCHNKTAPYVGSGIHLVRTTDIRNGKMDLRNTKKITEETYTYWARRAQPRSGDIFFTREAPMGEAAIVPEEEKVCLGQRTMLLRLFSELFNNQFLIYVIQSPSFQKRMMEAAIGMTVKHLRVGGVEDLLVPVPPKNEQDQLVNLIRKLFKICESFERLLTQKRKVSANLATAAITSLTGITATQQEAPMKAPKTELQAPVRLGEIQPANNDKAPLTTLLVRHNGEMNANDLWQRFGGEIDEFYAQLKVEVGKHWIADPFDVEDGELKPHHKMLEKEAE